LTRKQFGVLPGFLRTRPFADRTSGSGGNLALKDIAMGLRWVRENIGAFGGDPTRVTLMGHDTGAALVNLLLLAPYSKGRRRATLMFDYSLNMMPLASETSDSESLRLIERFSSNVSRINGKRLVIIHRVSVVG